MNAVKLKLYLGKEATLNHFIYDKRLSGHFLWFEPCVSFFYSVYKWLQTGLTFVLIHCSHGKPLSNVDALQNYVSI